MISATLVRVLIRIDGTVFVPTKCEPLIFKLGEELLVNRICYAAGVVNGILETTDFSMGSVSVDTNTLDNSDQELVRKCFNTAATQIWGLMNKSSCQVDLSEPYLITVSKKPIKAKD